MKQTMITLGELKQYLFGQDLLQLLKGVRDRQGDYGDITITITVEDKELGPFSFTYTQKGYPG